MKVNIKKFKNTSIFYRLKILVFVVGFLFSEAFQSATAQMRQIHLDLLNTNNEIKSMSFLSPSEGFVACSESGGDWVGYTTDTGRTFVKRYITLGNVDYGTYSVNLTFGFGLKGVKAFNASTILAYGDYGLVPSILRSTNGGLSYTLIYHSQFNPLQLITGIEDMVFPENGSVGYAVDADRILKTTNQGLTWSVSRVDPESLFNYLEAVDNNTVFAFSTNYTTNKLLKTTNGGASWQAVTLPTMNQGKLVYTHFLTANTGWLSMYDYDNNYYLYKTTNGGSSWVLQNNIEANPFAGFKLKFTDVNTGYAFWEQNTVYKTTDGGVTWEPLPRDNNFAYLGYSHIAMHHISANQFWAGGNRAFLELTTNAGGTPLPKAYFRIDTTGVAATNNVNLINHSRTGYTYKWLLNNVQISTAYNASYVHNPLRTIDTVKLIVNNGVKTDTVVKYQYFFLPVVVSSFTPNVGVQGTGVTIMGTNFLGASAVKFGNTMAQNFTVVSNTQINAVVGTGASGAVSVTTPQGTGTLNGFTYYPPPAINLSTAISDNILCKAESISVLIQNTEANVKYELIDSLNNSYGFVNSSGGTAGFITSLIFRTGNYRIKATRLNIASSAVFTNTIFILVEKTKSVFTRTRTNIIPGETVSFYNQSEDAATYSWTFNQDASIAGSTAAHPQNISYLSGGQKTLTFVSTSSNGCKDTLNTNAVFVFNKPVPNATCYGLAINDSDYNYYPDSPGAINEATMTSDNGYLISGFGNKPKLNSLLGNSKNFSTTGTAYVAKYTTDGVLSWYIYIRTGGNFTATEKDANGNIYILGHCKVKNYLTLINGDSIRVAATPGTNFLLTDKRNGFILKLDSNGNYLWHTIIDDPSPEYQGYPVMGGLPGKITISGSQIAISGTFLANLGYCRNGVNQTLVTLPNSTSANDLQNDFTFRIREDGSLVWHMYSENGAVNLRRGITGIGIDGTKNYYISGFYENQLKMHDVGNVNNITYTGTVGSPSSYLFKFDSTGRLVWKVNIKNTFAFRQIQIRDIATDAAGNSYVTGSSSILNNTQFFQVTNSNGSTTNVSHGSFFLMKFDSTGMYRWGTGSRYSYYGGGTSVLLKGNILYTTGTLSDNGQSSALFTMTSANGNDQSLVFYEPDFFIAQYDTVGILQRVVRSGQGTGGHMSPLNLNIDQNQHMLIAAMTDNYNGGNNTFTAFTNTITTNGADGFVVKLNPDYCYTTTVPLAQAGADRTTCAGTATTLGVSAIAGLTYYWTSSPAGFTSVLANPSVTPAVTTTYYLDVVNLAGLIAKDTVVVTVNPAPVANAGADQSICSGTSVTIGAAAVSGNTYVWTSNPPGFTATLANPTVTPSSTTQYYLTVSNTIGCTKRDTVIITTQNSFTPSVSISASATTVCSGSTVTFTAIPVNGGASPFYQWQVNGTSAGINSNTFSTNTLTNGSQVKVIMTSGHTCASPATAASNTITMAVNTLVPALTINGTTTVAAGQSSLLTTIPVNGGTTPAYQWQDSTNTHTWQNISGGTSSNINYTPAQTGIKVRCVLTSSATCALPAQVNSNVLIFTVNTVTATPPVPGLQFGIRYYPNPVTDMLHIDSLRLSDKWETIEINHIGGNRVLIQNINNRTTLQVPVVHLTAGVYIAVLRRKNNASVFVCFIKQ